MAFLGPLIGVHHDLAPTFRAAGLDRGVGVRMADAGQCEQPRASTMRKPQAHQYLASLTLGRKFLSMNLGDALPKLAVLNVSRAAGVK